MLVKNMFKKIGHSFGRFASLVAIILIGVGFYAGIRQSTPAIRDAENRFAASTNMMDLHIVSTLGLTDTDVERLEKLSSVEMVTAGYSKYVYSGDNVIRVLSIDNDINKFYKWDGKYPVKDNQCLADSRHFNVGDTITIREPVDEDDEDDSDDEDDKDDDEDEDEDKDDLTEHVFTVVGTITSPIYMGTDFGSANIGNGELYSYILVKKDVFDMEAYTDVYVTTAKTDEDIPYSDSYKEKLDILTNDVEKIKSTRETARVAELYQEAKDKANAKIEEKRSEIEEEVREEIEKEVREEIESKQEETKESLREKASMFGMTFEQFVATLSDSVTEALSPITDAQVDELVDEQMDDAMSTAMKEAREEAYEKIDIPECKWIIQNRNDVISNYKILSDQYKEVESIADIIPFFFIVIVVLMTSNTMSRMIAEERGEMGTLTSLGYSNAAIIGSYMIYVIVATLIGVVAGYFIGIYTLPGFVFTCFPLSVPDMYVTFNPYMFVGSVLASFVLMSGVTIFSCMKELRNRPAYLMRPVPPKTGKRLLLERITALWNTFSFSWKITLRNFARYKRRVIMTIIGVGGCTFLMFVGFALRDCISQVGDKQFSEIVHYDIMINLMDDQKSIEDIQGTRNGKKLVDEGLLVDPLMVRMESFKAVNSEDHSLDIYLLVPDSQSYDQFEEYFSLQYADARDVKADLDAGRVIEAGTPLSVQENEVIITPRIANLIGVGQGDSLTIVDEDDEEYTITVGGVTENYVSNYIYMSRETYVKTFKHGVMFNTILAKAGWEDKDTLTSRLYDSDDVANVTITETVRTKANEAVKGLDAVVVLLTVISSLLAFTVLYNLTAISISERTREIATLKVLGFTPFETNDYIYRETIISSVLGIAAGLLVSPYLLGRVLDVIAVDNLVFLRDINIRSFVIAASLSFIFTLVMMLVTFIRLFRINMIESLKSVD
ncbi:FtsX-like permease family protein [Lachnospiraceae bacterium NE2001]|nr:FtsX-like permease family protein [Lachnospiraceae bacterium NE2001]